MAKKKKFYVVWKGKNPGIYTSWAACKKEVIGYDGAKYKGFFTAEEARKAFDKPFAEVLPAGNNKPKGLATRSVGEPNLYSIAVDAASSGNPGRMEYRGVDTQTKKVLFHIGPFERGTNNIGEFLALVHGLAFLKQQKSDRIIYSDSQTAIGWVKKKKCNTKLKSSPKTKELFELVARAEDWLKKNAYTTPIAKWETKVWGEIPADFGRK